MSGYIDADKFERECMFDKNCNDMQDVIYKLRDYPSADVRENVRGEWIVKKDTTECSSCNTKWRDYRGLISTFSFCPDCGADMRGESC